MEDDLFSVFDSSNTKKRPRDEDNSNTTKWIKPEPAISSTNNNNNNNNSTATKAVENIRDAPKIDQGKLDREIQAAKKMKQTVEPLPDISFDSKKPDQTLEQLKQENPDDFVDMDSLKKLNEMGGIITAEGTAKSCVHEVLFPPEDKDKPRDGDIYNPKEPENPARTYPFKLDPFQQISVSCIERKESVLVSAHTSAGKTVVAEYSIAVALREGQRVIYTSPIKALSNQKYRDLQAVFGDVGLMTGDITINPNASCLVMTTEILRSMLYRGSETMREVAWVIFDEIHYLRDKERGVVWEETIILMPSTVRFVFLSATIPNAKEFAAWIAKIHKQPCHVVYTEYRPIPLQHYIFPAGGEGLHLVVDEKGVFREENFVKSLSGINSDAAPTTANKRKPSSAQKGPSDCYKIVKMIMERSYQPVIVFSFSKKECEIYALQMSKLDFNSDDEKHAIETIFNNAIDSLSESDKNLPAIINILPLLKRGIGIHHAGLLPILKEIIEILFQYGYIKALFATETFSIGLNMPAKTVIFTNVRKFDGANTRWISGGEYIQMSGRAGRRGLDERGIVILMVDEKMEPDVAKGMVKGQADRLTSSFWIGYSMLLNMLRVEDINPEDLLKKSFHQYQQEGYIPQLQLKVVELEKEHKEIVIAKEEQVEDFTKIKVQLVKLKEALRDFINQPSYVQPYLTAGRIVRIRDETTDWGIGIVLNFYKRPLKTSPNAVSEKSFEIISDVLLNTEMGSNGSKPCPPGQTGEPQIVPISIKLFDGVSPICLTINKNQSGQDFKNYLFKILKTTMAKFNEKLPFLDPIEDMGIQDPNFKKLVKKIEALEARFVNLECYNDRDINERSVRLLEKQALDQEIKNLKRQIRAGDEVILKEDLRAMKRILTKLNYITNDNVVQLKGRVAAEISAGDELVLSELLFMGVFKDLTPEQCAAVLSVFVFESDANLDPNNPKCKPELVPLYRMIKETALKVVQISKECKLEIDEKVYISGFNPNYMDVCYAWAQGASFADLIKISDTFEGNIIRGIRRLDELLRQMVAAAKSIGNGELEAKFSTAVLKIKRDIPFAGSLYL